MEKHLAYTNGYMETLRVVDVEDIDMLLDEVIEKLKIEEKKVDFTLSQFMFKITDSIGGFILNYYCNRKEFDKDKRIHYEDCRGFNEFFDEDYPIKFGIINISASVAL